MTRPFSPRTARFAGRVALVAVVGGAVGAVLRAQAPVVRAAAHRGTPPAVTAALTAPAPQHAPRGPSRAPC